MADDVNQSPTNGETPSGNDTVNRAAQSAHEAIDRVAAKAGPALNQLQDAASKAAESLESKAASLGEMEEVWMESARTCVREHPMASVLLALGAGMLISRLAN